MNIKFTVDENFIDIAEQQIDAILMQQRQAHIDSWNNSVLSKKIKPLLKWLGLSLCLLGFVICAVSLLFGANWCNSSMTAIVAMVIFALFAGAFFILDAFDSHLKAWVRKVSMNSCHRHAGKCVKSAREQQPFCAEYDIKGGAVSYFREKAGELKQVWNRPVKGVAWQANNATLVFKKQESLLPTMVILHESAEDVNQALLKQGVDCHPFEA